MSVEVKIDTKEAEKELSKEKLKIVIRDALQKTSLEAQREWTITSPVLTGALRNSKEERNFSEDGFEIWGKDYWQYVNYGHHGWPGNPFVTQISQNIPKYFEKYFNEEYERKRL